MPRHLRAAVLIGLASAAPAGAATFDDVFYFGDSLTDCCVFGRYTQENTPNWADILPPLIGADFTATVANNRAVGGAQSGEENIAVSLDEAAGYDTGFLNQVDRFIADGIEVDAQDLAGIWIGTNDIHPSARPEVPANLRAPLGPQPDVAALTDTIVGNIRAGVNELFDYGFRNFLILSPYDLADAAVTPEPGADAFATAYSVALTEALSTFATPDADTYFLDLLTLLNDVQANAEEFGFQFLTGENPCPPDTCADLPLAEQNEYIFADAIHLTNGFNQIIAEEAAEVLLADETTVIPLPAPAALLITAIGGLGLMRRRRA